MEILLSEQLLKVAGLGLSRPFSYLFFYYGGNHGGKHYFKFEIMWLEVDGFMENVRSWWSSYSFIGTSNFIMAKNLKASKSNLKKWNE